MRRVLLLGLALGVSAGDLGGHAGRDGDGDSAGGLRQRHANRKRHRPEQSVQTMGEDTRYLEGQGIPAIDAAGIVGNLMQES